jgi:hypothetical protein
VSALALLAPARPEHDPLGTLRKLVDDGFWEQAGWDAHTQVLTARAEHPTLGWSVCRVPGCDAQSSEVGGVCPSCRKAMVAAGSDELPAASGRSFVAGDGTCAVGCPRPWESRRRPLCAAHEHQRSAVLSVSIEGFLARTDLRPLPGFGPCRVLACTRLRPTGKSVLCTAHQTRWRELAGPQPQLAAWCRTEPGVARCGEISMRGLPDLVVAEILYAVQTRSAAGTKTSIAVLRSLCDQLRRAQAATVADLPEPERRHNHDLLRSLVAHARRAVTTPAEEQARDVWDLGVFGYPGRLDFTVIGHRWLREATKRWVAEDLPRRRGRNAPNIWWYYIASLAELSTSLRLQREDDGEVPARLGRGDIVAFTNRLAYLQHSGQLSLGRRIDVLRHTRTVLASARWAGLTRRGQALSGLPDDFALAKEDIPSKDRTDAPGRALPTEVMRQLCAGLETIHETCSGAGSDGDGQTITSPIQLPAGFSLPTGTPTQVVTAIEYALAQLGKPYQWGGIGNPNYDCSGLVMEAYLAAGITLPRTTYQQVYAGTPAYSASQLKPGDLIFTAGSDGTVSNPGHVGIYLGSDLVEDAPHAGADIQISKFDGGYWNISAVAFRRIVN